ncbi:alpha/beta fold hydrolase [Halarchaeum sp. P4]|uniref:alpha/beta fold hydrolase n=1 Tax=Halarchaeum sp. P4 TaxID=3421639 RepID=UPI003EC0E2CE
MRLDYRLLEHTRLYESHASDVLEAINIPFLVIGGEQDPIFPPEALRETATGIDDSRLEILADASHGAFEQRKKTFDKLVTAFLDGKTVET